MPRSATAALEQFGWDEGEIFSLLRVLEEEDFHLAEPSTAAGRDDLGVRPDDGRGANLDSTVRAPAHDRRELSPRVMRWMKP